MRYNSKALKAMAYDPNSNDEIKDKIQFAIQSSADMAQITIAVAVGLFGILSIFALLQTSDRGANFGQVWWYMKEFWKLPVFIVLSAAYWGVSLLGFTCFLHRVQFDALTAYYVKKRYPSYDEEFREIARRNIVTNFLTNRNEKLKKHKSKRVLPDPFFSVFVVIAILLWVFVGLF